jgi:hypothetical protein
MDNQPIGGGCDLAEVGWSREFVCFFRVVVGLMMVGDYC